MTAAATDGPALPPEPGAFPTHDILGLPVEYAEAGDAVAAVIRWAKAAEGGYICVSNVHQLMLARDDPGFRKVYLGARLRLPDSMVLQKARAFLHGARPPETLLGSRLTERLCAAAAAARVPIGLYGGSVETLATMRKALSAANPTLTIAFDESPPFRPLTDEDLSAAVAAIRAAGVRLLFVGLGCPKQENWMARAAPLMPDVVLIGVGAAFDTLSGVNPPAPDWIHRAGLEWAYRLSREPKRLFQRYISTSPAFLGHVLAQKLGFGSERRQEA